ncbi:phage tail sheath subtilisin-like domain-containing protein [Methylobacterium sp. WCS2018Hpa-22]|uniref:phage tail sheath subtilisin-like domain-containing protein n=1 Tax=Methylobacterium sp. WCS2018Hpa-22 TaxID=3073633 RepID=UPI00288B3817|nr:phage tail sheath subtilisin-like domain-containing protein [Methylobacterium sp. WCS2018Hpa-22]
MSLTDFLHGVETVTVDSGPRSIQAVRSSVIGLVYTAPEADPVKFPLNVPVLFNRRADMAGLGKTGTGPRALDGIFDQIGALVVGVRVPHSTTERGGLAFVVGGVDSDTGALTGVHALRAAESMLGVSPMILIAPGFTHQRINAAKRAAIRNQGSGYTTATVSFAGGGPDAILPKAKATIVDGKVTAIVFNFFGYYITESLTMTISGDGTGATGVVVIDDFANPVVAELLGVAEELRAHIIADGPSTTDTAALAYRGDFGSRRIFLVDPKVSGFSTTAKAYVDEPASARVAGHIAWVDDQFGFWESPSNKVLKGVGGLGRPIDSIGKNSRANILNENRIATVIRDNGFRLWGNRTLSDDPKFTFLSISRTADMVDLSIAKAHRWAVDRGITKTYFSDVTMSVNAFLRSLKTRGAIQGGECWVDEEFNTAADIADGHATFSYDFGGIYPAERLTFRSSLTDKYIANIFAK